MAVWATLALAAALSGVSQDRTLQSIQYDLLGADGKPSGAFVSMAMSPRTPPKNSPQKFGTPPTPYQFNYTTGGLGLTNPSTSELRFRVYTDGRTREGDISVPVCRQLLRMWTFLHDGLRFDHHKGYNSGVIDVYLCIGGKAGGAQRFDMDDDADPPVRVNTIYIYDIGSFTDPMERAREIAHEYGHAVIPPIGGFKTPEDWGNGYFGERLFLRWLRDEMRAKRIPSEDVQGLSEADLTQWIAKNADPLEAAAATIGPDNPLLGQTGPKAMDSYIGLGLWAYTTLGPAAFARSVLLTGSTKAPDYAKAVAMAAEEPAHRTLTLPAAYLNKPVWIPVGSGRIEGGKVLKRGSGWWQVEASGPLEIYGRA